MVPVVELPCQTPSTDHEMFSFAEAYEAEAVKLRVPPVATVAEPGVRVTVHKL